MESGPRRGKEQDFGLNRIYCPYFVPSIWLRLRHYVQVFCVFDSILSVQRHCQASSGIEGCQRLDHTIY
ncbi:hypothetical protein F383_23468 [Gossypium arboreum]|uniref:Uncharacterized protein n=1 Tax=Gossypium arboreum TaxID=29729 RepID=A0A0B0NUS2_GOSAR|nr:hypothetical protein F383_23468 [Gossypium arboreum]